MSLGAGLIKTISLIIISSTITNVFATKEDSVKISNIKDNITLGGTLALPEDNISPEAIILLISGSGPQNRDEEILGHKPFKRISDRLSEKGYGVLRVDDRGVGESTGNFENAVLNDFVSDASSCVDYLRDRFPNTKIGALGHSQGGNVAIKLASKERSDSSPAIDFIITLAAPAWRGDSLIMSQCRAIATAATGKWDGETLERKLLDIAMSDINTVVKRTLLYKTYLEELDPNMRDIPAVQTQIFAQIEPMASDSYKDLLTYDPGEDIKNISIPFLALNGTKDLQVSVNNLETIQNLCPRAKTVAVENHNHLFQPATTGMIDEYATAGSSPSDKTIEIILQYLEEILNKN